MLGSEQKLSVFNGIGLVQTVGLPADGNVAALMFIFWRARSNSYTSVYKDVNTTLRAADISMPELMATRGNADHLVWASSSNFL